MSRTVRLLLVAVLAFLAGVVYARRDQIWAVLAADPGPAQPQVSGDKRGLSPAHPRAAELPARGRFRVGMNMEGVSDWSQQWAFVNVFKTAREWQEDGQKPFRYDARGAPLLKAGQKVATYLYRGLGGHYPGGRYVVTWRGMGRVHLNKFDVARFVSAKPNRLEVDVTPADNGLLIEVSASDPADPVHDIRVVPAALENHPSLFHPLFLERLRPCAALRFMGWQQTNNSPVRTWAERAKPEDARWSTPTGVPLEVMIDLANTLGADPWFCIPHLADDDFVMQFARTVRDRLKPGLKCHVEYSNEVWNFSFGQAHHAYAEGKRLRLGEPDTQRYYSQRSVEIFRIFETEFGGRGRLVRVLAAQSANVWAGEQILKWKDAYKHADALAVAPYFGWRYGEPDNATAAAALSLDRLLDVVDADIDGDHRNYIREYAALCRKYGLEMVAYEGGQHLAGVREAANLERLTSLFIAANRHPRMYALTRKHLDQWSAGGGGLYMAFLYVGAPSKWGSWGVLEYQDQPTTEAHKYRALLDGMKNE